MSNADMQALLLGFVVAATLAVSKINWRKIWIDPNWRHEVTNSVLSAVAVGVLTLLAGYVLFMLTRAGRAPVWTFMVVGAVAGTVIGGLFWTLAHKLAKSTDKNPLIITVGGGSGFVTVEAPKEKNLDNRLAVFVYAFQIANNLDNRSTTLKEVVLSYKLKRETHEAEAVIFPLGKLEDGTDARMFFSGTNQFILLNWMEMRHLINENKPREPGAIWNGSAIFVLGQDVISFDDITDLNIVARDYLDNVGKAAISPLTLNKTKVRKEPFLFKNDSIIWSP